MATKITWDIIESYLNCKYKGHLKLTGGSGAISDYEAMTTAARALSREQTLTRLAARFGEGAAASHGPECSPLYAMRPLVLHSFPGCVSTDGTGS